MEIIGYLASILIGVSLGLIGSGGSILTVPILVYLFGISPLLATAYSLFIVGTTSFVGSFSYIKKGLVNLQAAVFLGIPSIVAVFFSRAWVVPVLPKQILSLGNFTITKNIFLMALFAILMIVASFRMIKKANISQNDNPKNQFKPQWLIIIGIGIGLLTGLVGAGGGFLIIPVLVLFYKLPMKEAIGTSLVIITAKSLIGFLGESNIASFNWFFLITIVSFAIVGIFIGMTLSKKIDGNKLKPAFGWFVFVMGLYIFIKEMILH